MYSCPSSLWPPSWAEIGFGPGYPVLLQRVPILKRTRGDSVGFRNGEARFASLPVQGHHSPAPIRKTTCRKKTPCHESLATHTHCINHSLFNAHTTASDGCPPLHIYPHTPHTTSRPQYPLRAHWWFLNRNVGSVYHVLDERIIRTARFYANGLLIDPSPLLEIDSGFRCCFSVSMASSGGDLEVMVS